MHIAIAIERFDPMGGGQERSTHQIARHLAQRGHAVTILAGDAPPDAGEENIRVVNGHALNFKHRVDPVRFAKWAKVEFAGGGFDATLSMTMLVPAAVVQPRTGVMREAFERHLAARSRGSSRWLGRLVARLNPKVNALLRLEQQTANDPAVRAIAAGSTLIAGQLEKHYGLRPPRVQIIPNGAEMPAIGDEQRRAHRVRIRAAFAVPDDAVAFLFATWHPKVRGYAPLLHALKRLVDRGRRVVAFMAGHIAYGQQHLAAALGVREHVRMIGPTQRMIELFSAADVTIVPTFYDPANKLVLESLTLGVPVVTTAFDGASEWVADPGRGSDGAAERHAESVPRNLEGKNAMDAPGGSRGRVIADPLDIDALAGAMESLLDPAERARCAAACAGLSDTLSMRRHVDALERILLAAALPAQAAPL